MWHSLRKPSLLVIAWVAAVLVILYIVYRVVDPLPPRHLAIAAGIPGSPYDNFARQYARILSRHGVQLQVHNSTSTVQSLDLLRDPASGVQASLTTFGFTQADDENILYSLGGIFDAPIFIFYRGKGETVTQVAQFRGKRISVGMPGSALRVLMSEALQSAGVLQDVHLVDRDYADAIDGMIAGDIDVVMFPSQLDGDLLRRALAASAVGVRQMNVTQAEAIAKIIPGLKRVVLWRGLISFAQDVPNVDIDLLAFRSRLLVRKDLHPALQYLLLEAMREVHWGPGPFNRLGEFPAEQANDLRLSPTAEAFYRSGSTFSQRYMSFWLASLLDRMVFFVIPILAMLVPVIGFAPVLYRILHTRPINRLHHALTDIESDLALNLHVSGAEEYRRRVDAIATEARILKVPRSFAADLHRLKLHLRMVEEDLTQRFPAS